MQKRPHKILFGVTLGLDCGQTLDGGWRHNRNALARAKQRLVYFDWLLVCGISLPVPQLFLTAIENVLWRGVGNLTRLRPVWSDILTTHC